MSVGFSPWKSRRKKKWGQGKSCCYRAGFYFERGKMSTSSSSPRSSPRWPKSNQWADKRKQRCLEEQCWQLPLECWTRVFNLQSDACVPQSRLRHDPRLGVGDGGLLELGTHLPCHPVPSLQHNKRAVSSPYLCLWAAVVRVSPAIIAWSDVHSSHQQILCKRL